MVELILMYSDSPWFQRNQCTFTDRKLEAEYLAVSVSSHLRTFHDANGWPERLSEALLDKALIGSPPDGTRIHFDAGILEGKAGLCAIAISRSGAFIRAMADCVPGVTDPLFAEGMTMALALELAQDFKDDKVVIVGDCLNLIRMIRGDGDVPLGYTNLLARLLSLLASGDLDNPCWIPGDQYGLAHSLARFAK